MITKLILLGAILASGCLAQPTFVNVDQNSGTCLSVNLCSTAGVSHTAGNFLIAYVASSINSISSVTNTAGDTWTRLTFDGSGNVGFLMTYYTKSTAGNATDIVTANSSSLDPRVDITVLQYSGTASSIPIDVSSSGSDGTGTSLVSGTFTTHTSGQILTAGFLTEANDAFTAGSGYTLRSTAPDGQFGIEDKSVSSIQTNVTSTMTANLGNVNGAVWTVVTLSSTNVGAMIPSSVLASMQRPPLGNCLVPELAWLQWGFRLRPQNHPLIARLKY